MIEMEMSRDITEFSPKIISIFDRRQLICVGIAALYGIPIFSMLNKYEVDLTTNISICVFLMAPAIACGWVKMYGVPLEQFILKSIIPMYASPNKRTYKSKDIVDDVDPPDPLLRNIPKKKLKRKEKRALQALHEQYDARK